MKNMLKRIASLMLVIIILSTTLIIPASASTSKPVDGGVYYIESAIGNNLVIDCAKGSTADRANIEMWGLHTGKNQQIRLKYVSDGYYTLQLVHSGKVIDVKGGSKTPGANVHQWELGKNQANQQFKFIDAGNGYYYIQVRNSGMYLDIEKGNTKDGANLIVFTPQKSDNQKFRLVPVSSNPLDLKISGPDSISLAPGQTTTVKFTFAGKRISSVGASLSGGLTGGFTASNWRSSPANSDATIKLTAPKGFKSGSVTFNLLVEGNVVKSQTVKVSAASSSSKITTAQIQRVLDKYGYKNGTYWTSKNAKGYCASTVPGGSGYEYRNAWECSGYAIFVMSEVSGVKDITESSKWKRLTSVDSLQIGDVIRSSSGHSAVVLSVDGNGKITVTECWGNAQNKIHQGPFNNSCSTLDSIKKTYGLSHVWRYVG